MAAIGRVLLMPKGTYSGSTVYNALDWVRDNGAAWVCKVDGTIAIAPPTLPTTSNANWQLLAADGSVSGSIDWTNVNNKPFDSIDTTTDFSVDGSNKMSIKRNTFGKMRIVSGGATVDLAASGDSIFEIDAGTNVTITPDNTTNPKKITINSTGGGGGSYTASKGVKITTSGDIQADLKDATVGSLAAATRSTTNNREYPVALDSNSNLSVNVPWTDTTYSSQAEAQGGTAESLCTTGEKYTWNHKANTSDLDDYIATSIVSSGYVSFTGVDDTPNYSSMTQGYEPHVWVDSNSVNLSPYAKLSTASGFGTNNLTLIYETDADNGATVKLRVIR